MILSDKFEYLPDNLCPLLSLTLAPATESPGFNTYFSLYSSSYPNFFKSFKLLKVFNKL